MFTAEPIPQDQTALVLRRPNELTFETIPVWDINKLEDPDLVLVRIEACGVCGSDYRYFAGENPWAQHTLGRSMPNPPNMVLGHEYAGVVVAVKSEANRALLGKRVAPTCSKTCGRCSDCLSGRTRLCQNTVHLGHGQGWGSMDVFPGAYAQYAPSWGSTCFELPEHVSFGAAAMLDILAVAVHVCETGGIQSGRDVLVIGCGPAGNAIAQVAAIRGARRVFVMETSQLARDIAITQGIGTLVTADEVNELGADFGTIFDSVGSQATLESALRWLGPAGTLVNMAVHDADLRLNPMQLSGERRIVTSCNFEVGDFPTSLKWLSQNRLRVDEWLQPIRLEEGPGWFQRVLNQPEDKPAFKLLFQPNA